MTGQGPSRIEGRHPTSHQGGRPEEGATARHSWMMIACCVPMLAVAVALVLTGVVSPGFLVVALVCTAMMAMMMRGGGHSGGPGGHGGGPGERPT